MPNACKGSQVAGPLTRSPNRAPPDRVDRQYTDTHGASIVGFAFAHILGFKLMPRLKNIDSARLYRPAAGEDDSWPNPAPVLSTKTINWDLIRRQYNQIVKYRRAPPGHP